MLIVPTDTASLEALQDLSPSSSIKDVFDYYFSEIEIDDAFCKRIINFDHHFVRKNATHVAFFGSPLLGVHPAKWLPEDKARWMDDVLQVDEIGLTEDYRNLYNVETDFEVVSDPVNATFIYVTHRLMNARGLSARLREAAMESTISIMHYKFITSVMSNSFRYPADKAVAEATYNSLSMKFTIKQEGSWGKLVSRRAKRIVSSSGLHYRTFKEIRNDESFLYAISDIQTGIRKIIVSYTKAFYDVRDANGKILTTSSMMETEDGYMVKDVNREVDKHINYLDSIVPDSRDFIRKDLLGAVLEVNTSASPDDTVRILEYVSREYARDFELQGLCKNLLVYLFNFLNEKSIRTSEISKIAFKFKSMLTGSRVTEPEILEIREIGDRIARKATARSRRIPISPERTAALLYIALRALTHRHYS